MAEFTVHLPDGTSKIVSGFVGQYVEMAGGTPPAHTLLANGATVSRTAYAELFEVIGTTYGEGDGSTTFNLPDLTGRFLRGTGGNAAALGVAQGDAIRNMTGDVDFSFRNIGVGINPQLTNGVFHGINYTPDTNISHGGLLETTPRTARFDASRVVPTAEENRPVNMSCTICIVYE